MSVPENKFGSTKIELFHTYPKFTVSASFSTFKNVQQRIRIYDNDNNSRNDKDDVMI